MQLIVRTGSKPHQRDHHLISNTLNKIYIEYILYGESEIKEHCRTSQKTIARLEDMKNKSGRTEENK